METHESQPLHSDLQEIHEEIEVAERMLGEKDAQGLDEEGVANDHDFLGTINLLRGRECHDQLAIFISNFTYFAEVVSYCFYYLIILNYGVVGR